MIERILDGVGKEMDEAIAMLIRRGYSMEEIGDYTIGEILNIYDQIK